MNINGAINRDTQDKLLLNTTLDNLRNNQNYVSSNMETTIAGSAPTSVRNEKLVNLGKQISDKKGQLARAKNVYGDKYPEIAQMQAEIESLETEQSDLEKQDSQQRVTTPGSAPRVVVNPQMERQLQDYKAQQSLTQTQLASKAMEIEELTRQRGEYEKQMAVYQKRIEESPLNGQQYAQLLSDFSMAKTAYQEFQKKQEQSQTSQNLEEHKAGENLEVLDAASVPEKPIEPNRLAYAGIGTFGGLAFGLMLAAAKEVKNTALKNLKDVRAYTNLPVLSSIPLLENALLVRRKRRLVWLAWSSAIIVGVTLMSGSMYYYMSSS
jgi:succinoglycan biosynthesis transport protein ExoP